jgi:hypothetical protein
VQLFGRVRACVIAWLLTACLPDGVVLRSDDSDVPRTIRTFSEAAEGQDLQRLHRGSEEVQLGRVRLKGGSWKQLATLFIADAAKVRLK